MEATQQTTFNYEQAMLGRPDEPAIDPKGFYFIDFDKVTRAEDIVAILAAVNFSFIGNHPRVHLVAHLLDRENVQYPKEDQFGQPTIEKIKLPELKKIKLPKSDKADDGDSIKVDGYSTNESSDNGL